MVDEQPLLVSVSIALIAEYESRAWCSDSVSSKQGNEGIVCPASHSACLETYTWEEVGQIRDVRIGLLHAWASWHAPTLAHCAVRRMDAADGCAGYLWGQWFKLDMRLLSKALR